MPSRCVLEVIWQAKDAVVFVLEYPNLCKDCHHEFLVSQAAFRRTKLVSLYTIGQAQTRMSTAWIEDQVKIQYEVFMNSIMTSKLQLKLISFHFSFLSVQ